MKFKIFIILLFVSNLLAAQRKYIIDEIITVVGNEIILKSDIKKLMEGTYLSDKNYNKIECNTLKDAISQRILLNQAYIDSLEIKPEDVTNTINRRLDFFIRQFSGDVSKLEAFYGKTISEIKEEMRDPVKEQMLVEKIRGMMIENIKITPREVKLFFDNIEKDSLPFYDTEIELSQIVIYPKPTEEEKKKAYKKIEKIRNEIISGKKEFKTSALLYSEDDLSAVKGGGIGMRSKNELQPEFAATAMKLQKDSISEIVETKFGYHIIKMVERKGEMIDVKHILIRPKINYQARVNAINLADSIRDKIINDTITFYQAAMLYSEDEQTKNNGGLVADKSSGATKITVKDLDASTFFVVDTMKVGSICEPTFYISQDAQKGYRILYLKNKIKPHRADFEQDYPKLQDLALEDKKNKKLLNWINKNKGTMFIKLSNEYEHCKKYDDFFNFEMEKIN